MHFNLLKFNYQITKKKKEKLPPNRYQELCKLHLRYPLHNQASSQQQQETLKLQDSGLVISLSSTHRSISQLSSSASLSLSLPLPSSQSPSPISPPASHRKHRGHLRLRLWTSATSPASHRVLPRREPLRSPPPGRRYSLS